MSFSRTASAAVPGNTVSHEPVVSIRNLHKRFGANRVLHDISLTIEPGHIVGLIGPNSGGKSTLLRHLPGIYLPTGGSCQVFGRDAGKLSDQDLARIGYVHQEGELMDWMSTEQIIRYVAAHYRHWNRGLEDELVSSFELDRKEQVAVMSPGQRQKLSLLLAVCFEPELLVLDEPASALDPLARRHFLELLLNLIQDQRRTIVISSHILSDIEKVIDHVLIMHKGQFVRDCSFDALLEEYVKLDITSLGGPLPGNWPIENILACEQDEHRAMLIVRQSAIALDKLASCHNCRIVQRPLSLEEIYPLVMQESGPAFPTMAMRQEVHQ